MPRFGTPAAFAAVVALAAAGGGAARETASNCPPLRSSPAYERGVMRALAAKRDVWGEALLRAPGGPTYERARRYLHPLLHARARGKTALTESGVYYLAF